MKAVLFGLAALIALPACSLFQAGEGEAPAPAGYARIEFAEPKASADERAACTAAGGEIVASGKLQWENCVQIFADAGKTCSGDSNCTGKCRYTGGAELAPGSAVSGTCQVTDASFGCNTTVENGKIVHTLCVD
jgi:hypothetical protein